MSTNQALNDVLAQAEAAAAAHQPAALVPAPTTLPTPANSNQLSKPTLEDFANGGGLDVDTFLQVKAEGFRLDKQWKGLIDEMVVEIDVMEMQPIWSARGETAGQTTFLRSRDGHLTDRGENFQFAMAQLRAKSQKFEGPYQSFEIPLEVVEDIKDPKSAMVAESGTRVGYTPSVTGAKPIQKFLKKLFAQHPGAGLATIKVKVTHEKKTNSHNNEWGVLNFELLEIVG